ncbi:hypothetical protein J1N35_029293 [Gossypium stocksii]|uniref:Uncharacterized protein n=1 Tax=Gossypium stocksii TaxID=47602 RepID=A0A9D3UXR9_9ROSI|nr:hypothetical protein J1N35_029293 [Gossypium stocksii]
MFGAYRRKSPNISKFYKSKDEDKIITETRIRRLFEDRLTPRLLFIKEVESRSPNEEVNMVRMHPSLRSWKAIPEEIHIMIPIQQGIRDEAKETLILNPITMTNEKV